MELDFLQLATPGIRNLKPYRPGKPLLELEKEYGIQNAVKLASNENPLGTSPNIITALQNQLSRLERYPDSNGFILKQALAEKHRVSLDYITLGNGSNDVLELIARSFVTSEQAIMYSQHAFIVYPLVTQAIGAAHQVVPARQWGHDLQAMQQQITEKTRLIFIANPNNPTGTWLEHQALEAFLQTVAKHILVVVDEAYFEYIDNPNYPDCSLWLDKYPNLIVTRTFSKVHGLAALRIGYSLSHPEITDLLNRARQPFNVNQLALLAAKTALEDDAHVAASVALNKVGMLQLTSAFAEMGLAYIESGGNFVTVNVGDGEKIYQALLPEGVIVRPIKEYEMPAYIRISVGLEEENTKCINSLKKVLTY